MTRLTDEDGFTIMELLVAASLMIVVLGALLTSWEGFYRNQNATSRQNEAQDRVRNVVDILARTARNTTSPTNGAPLSVDKATATDLVIKTVDPVGPNAGSNRINVRRVRYCLNTTDPSNASLWRQYQTWTSATAPGVPSTASCPQAASAGAWTAGENVGSNIVNYANGQTRPLFSYDNLTLLDIRRIGFSAFIDVNPNARPVESQLRTAIFLRNQNRAPEAAFDLVSFVVNAVTHTATVVMNGSLSTDPEGDALTYVWYDGATKLNTCSGIVCNVSLSGGGNHSLTLHVFDSSGLEAVSATQVVNIP